MSTRNYTNYGSRQSGGGFYMSAYDTTYSPNNPFPNVSLPDYILAPNKEEEARYNHQLSAMQWESQRAMQLDEREYNSPAAQSQRMRAAGMNPDLQNIDAGNSSGSSPNVPNPSISSPKEPLDTIGDGIAAVSSIVNMATSLTSAIDTHKMAELNLQGKEMDNLSQIAGIIRPFVRNNYGDLKSGKITHDEWMNNTNQYFNGLSHTFKYNNHNLGMVYAGLGETLDELDKAFYSTKGDIEAYRHAYLAHKAYTGYSPDDNEVIKHFLTPFIDAKVKSLKSGFELSKVRSDFQKDNFSTLAKSKSVRTQLIKGLSNDFKNGSTFAGALLLAYDMFLQKYNLY